MARPLRIEYPGAIYHVMARGDGGKVVFESEDDRQAFLERLGEVCGSHGWRVHAWVLMGNHFHLLVETPQANLVSGMKWLMGVYSQGWNCARLRHGHVFQGRYRSVPVNGSDADGWYFRIAADYIHLNPARVGLAGGRRGAVAAYRWSSLGAYAKGKGPPWLVMERVLAAFELSQDGRGRRAYVRWIEERARQGGEISEEAMKAMRRGWYLGPESFKDRLLRRLERPAERRRESVSGEAVRDRSLREAERLVRLVSPRLGLPRAASALEALPKGDRRKVLLAILLRKRTIAPNGWIASRLAMGQAASVSRLTGTGRGDRSLAKELEELEKSL